MANNRINELKQDLESKNSQITSYLIEIKEISQEKSQLNQNIAELEIKKIELMNKIHSSPVSSPTPVDSENAQENGSINQPSVDITNLIKVKNIYKEVIV